MRTTALILLLSGTAYAKPDRLTVIRETYVRLWKQTITDMFADAGPTEVKLQGSTLVIRNQNCGDPQVRSVLEETFGEPRVREKMKEIRLDMRCMVASNE